MTKQLFAMEPVYKMFEENKVLCRVAGGIVVAATGLLAYRWIGRRKSSNPE